MIFKARWKSKFRAIIVVSMTTIMSLWVNSATAGLNDDLIKAAEKGNIYAVKSIIDGGADVNAKINDGMSSLMYASLGGHLDVVRALIANGADVNAKTDDGVSSLMYASLGGYLEIVRTLAAEGADVNAKTNDGRTALMVASVGGHLEVVQTLLTKEADINAKESEVGATALMAASEGGHLGVVQALLSKGANVNAKTKDGWTALLMASIKGHQRIEELLKAADTKVNVRPHTAKPVEVALQPVPTVPARDSVSPLSGPEQVITDKVAPGQVTHAEGGAISQPASASLPIAIPVVSLITEPVTSPAAPAPPKAHNVALTDTKASTPQAPTAEEKETGQKRVFYTLLAGETISHSRFNTLLKKLKASGLQPVVREENKPRDVYRLVKECFNTRAAAQNHQTDLARQEKQAFIVHDASQFCVVAASFFLYDDARTGQIKLAKKGIQTEIVKKQVTLTTWQVTVGLYNDSPSAAAALKRLAERGIDVVAIPWDK